DEALVFAVALDAADASGKRAFRCETIQISRLVRGTWRFTLEVLRRRSPPASNGELELSGRRVVAASTVDRAPVLTPRSSAFALLSFLAVLFVAGSRRWIAWFAVALALVQALAFAPDPLP